MNKNNKKEQREHNENHVYGEGVQAPGRQGMPQPDGKHNTNKTNQPK